MSGESARHVRLVEALITTVESRHQSPRGLMVFADHHRFGADRPMTIGGFTPDLFASDVPATFRVVGEAKTADDLESERSRRQVEAFLDHLCLYPDSTFYLAVPYFTAPRARFLLRSWRRVEHSNVVTEVLACV
jgi:hypothetical protein